MNGNISYFIHSDWISILVNNFNSSPWRWFPHRSRFYFHIFCNTKQECILSLPITVTNCNVKILLEYIHHFYVQWLSCRNGTPFCVTSTPPGFRHRRTSA